MSSEKKLKFVLVSIIGFFALALIIIVLSVVSNHQSKAATKALDNSVSAAADALYRQPQFTVNGTPMYLKLAYVIPRFDSKRYAEGLLDNTKLTYTIGVTGYIDHPDKDDEKVFNLEFNIYVDAAGESVRILNKPGDGRPGSWLWNLFLRFTAALYGSDNPYLLFEGAQTSADEGTVVFGPYCEVQTGGEITYKAGFTGGNAQANFPVTAGASSYQINIVTHKGD